MNAIVPQWLASLDSWGFAANGYLLSVLWQSSLLLGAAAGLAWLLRRRRAATRHALWVAALAIAPFVPILTSGARSVGAPQAPVPVLPSYEAPVVVPQKHEAKSETSNPPSPIRNPRTAVGRAEPSGDPRPDISEAKSETTDSRSVARRPQLLRAFPWAWALLLYLTGLGLFVSWVVAGHIRIRLWIRRSSAVSDPRTLAAFRRAAEALGGTRFQCRALESPDVGAPVSVGVLYLRVLFPVGLAGRLSDDELRTVVLHETAHLRRRDPLVLSLVSLVRAAFFFHPLVWVAARQVSLLSEQCADDAVLDATGEPLPYARLLARLAEDLPARRILSTELAAGIVLSKSVFLQRVEAILGDRARIRRLSRWTLTATLAGLLASVLAAASLPLAEKRGVGRSSNGPPASISVPDAGARDFVLPLTETPYSRTWTDANLAGGAAVCRSYDLDRDATQDVVFAWRNGRLVFRQWFNGRMTLEEFEYGEDGALKTKRIWPDSKDNVPYEMSFSPPAEPAIPKLDKGFARETRNGMTFWVKKKSATGETLAALELDGEDNVVYASWREDWGPKGSVWVSARRRPDGTGFHVESRTYKFHPANDGYGSHAFQSFGPDGALIDNWMRVVPEPAFKGGRRPGEPPNAFKIADRIGAAGEGDGAQGNRFEMEGFAGYAGFHAYVTMIDRNADGAFEGILETRKGGSSSFDALMLEDRNANGQYEKAEYKVYPSAPIEYYSHDNWVKEVSARSSKDDGVFDTVRYRDKGQADWTETNDSARERNDTQPSGQVRNDTGRKNYLGQTDYPKIASLDPPNGASDVDPTREFISVTFDRPMRGGYSWVDKGKRPKIERIEWVGDRECRAWVKLEPGKEYGVWLNFGPNTSKFRSVEGISSDRTYWQFRTRGERDAPSTGTIEPKKPDARTPDSDRIQSEGEEILGRMAEANRCWLLPPLEPRKGLVYEYRQEAPHLERVMFDEEGRIMAQLEKTMERHDRPTRQWFCAPDGTVVWANHGDRFVREEKMAGSDRASGEDLLHRERRVNNLATGLGFDCAVTLLARDPKAFQAEYEPSRDGKTYRLILTSVGSDCRLFAGTMLAFASWAYMHDVPYARSEIVCDAATHSPLEEKDYDGSDRLVGQCTFSDYLDDPSGRAPGRIRAAIPYEKDGKDNSLDMDAEFAFVRRGVWLLKKVHSEFRADKGGSTAEVTVVAPEPGAFSPILAVRARLAKTRRVTELLRDAPEGSAAADLSDTGGAPVVCRAAWGEGVPGIGEDRNVRPSIGTIGVRAVRGKGDGARPEIALFSDAFWTEYEVSVRVKVLDARDRVLCEATTNTLVRAEGAPAVRDVPLVFPAESPLGEAQRVSAELKVERQTAVYHGRGIWMDFGGSDSESPPTRSRRWSDSEPSTTTAINFQSEGEAILRRMAEANRYWLLGPPEEIKTYSFVFHAHRATVGRTYEVRNAHAARGPLRQGIAWDVPLRTVAGNPAFARFKSIERDEKTIRLEYDQTTQTLAKCGMQIEPGQGDYGGGWCKKGSLVLDSANLTPISFKSNCYDHTFGDYVEVDPGHWAPLSMRIIEEHTHYVWRFKIHGNGLWFFDSGRNESTEGAGDGKGEILDASVSDVRVNPGNLRAVDASAMRLIENVLATPKWGMFYLLSEKQPVAFVSRPTWPKDKNEGAIPGFAAGPVIGVTDLSWSLSDDGTVSVAAHLFTDKPLDVYPVEVRARTLDERNQTLDEATTTILTILPGMPIQGGETPPVARLPIVFRPLKVPLERGRVSVEATAGEMIESWSGGPGTWRRVKP